MKAKKRWGWALALMASVLALSYSADAKPSMSHDGVSPRLTRRSAAGNIAVRAGRKQFPATAEVSLARTRANSAKRRIKDGLKHRRHNVLAMYDISIKANGRKWQPDADDPVRVTVDLDEPVAVTAKSALGVVHLSDDGAVEELPASRYGFTYNAAKTAVTSFWVDSTGFSIYAIVDASGLVTPRRFYHSLLRPSVRHRWLQCRFGAALSLRRPVERRHQRADRQGRRHAQGAASAGGHIGRKQHAHQHVRGLVRGEGDAEGV